MKNNWINIDHDFSTAFLIITAGKSLLWAVKLSHVLLALYGKLWKDTNLFCQRTEEHLVIRESMVIIHCQVKGEENRTITQSLKRVILLQLIPEHHSRDAWFVGRIHSQGNLTSIRFIFISSSAVIWHLFVLGTNAQHHGSCFGRHLSRCHECSCSHCWSPVQQWSPSPGQRDGDALLCFAPACGAAQSSCLWMLRLLGKLS